VFERASSLLRSHVELALRDALAHMKMFGAQMGKARRDVSMKG